MYYVWQIDAKLSDRFSYFGNKPAGLQMSRWISGAKIVEKLPTLELVTDEKYPTDLSDLLLIQCELPVVSPRLVDVFEQLSIENIQYFPATIKNHETGDINNKYKVLNVLGAINCLDSDSAELARARRTGEIIRLRRYKLLPDRIEAYSSEQAKRLIFRLGEFNWHLIVHKAFKDTCESQGITGCKFTPTEEYV
jgi:hypothetical protein